MTNEYYTLAVHNAEYAEEVAIRYNIECSEFYNFEEIEISGYIELMTKEYALNMFTPEQDYMPF